MFQHGMCQTTGDVCQHGVPLRICVRETGLRNMPGLAGGRLVPSKFRQDVACRYLSGSLFLCSLAVLPAMPLSSVSPENPRTQSTTNQNRSQQQRQQQSGATAAATSSRKRQAASGKQQAAVVVAAAAAAASSAAAALSTRLFLFKSHSSFGFGFGILTGPAQAHMFVWIIAAKDPL